MAGRVVGGGCRLSSGGAAGRVVGWRGLDVGRVAGVGVVWRLGGGCRAGLPLSLGGCSAPRVSGGGFGSPQGRPPARGFSCFLLSVVRACVRAFVRAFPCVPCVRVCVRVRVRSCALLFVCLFARPGPALSPWGRRLSSGGSGGVGRAGRRGVGPSGGLGACLLHLVCGGWRWGSACLLWAAGGRPRAVGCAL